MEASSSISSALFNKKKVELTKLKKNIYKLESFVENKNIYLEKLINFELIHLFYKVNMNFFEIVEFEILNENEAILFVLMKPLLKELGVQPRYVNLRITKKIEGSDVFFYCVSCNEFIKNTHQFNKNAIKSPLLTVTISCKLMNPHSLYISETLTFDETYEGFTIMEKFLSQVLKVIFKQTISAVEQINKK
jgi:hypothetical protein